MDVERLLNESAHLRDRLRDEVYQKKRRPRWKFNINWAVVWDEFTVYIPMAVLGSIALVPFVCFAGLNGMVWIPYFYYRGLIKPK
jgi:hypothetical protein